MCGQRPYVDAVARLEYRRPRVVGEPEPTERSRLQAGTARRTWKPPKSCTRGAMIVGMTVPAVRDG